MLRKIALLAILLVIVAAAAFILSQRREPAVSASGILGSSPAVGSAGFARATGPQPLTFPADYGPHPDYQTEWWYYTGNLDDADGHHFGYQFTIFRRAALPPDQRADRASDPVQTEEGDSVFGARRSRAKTYIQRSEPVGDALAARRARTWQTV